MKNNDLTQIELFAGIGGFGLAAEWAGIQTILQVEIDPFCQKVLEKNFPHAQRHTDIHTFDGRPTAVPLTLFAEVSHASPTATPESAGEMTTTVRSGLRCFESSQKLRRSGLLAKTLLGSSAWTAGVYSPALSLTWKVSGIRSKHLLFRLVPSARPTEGTDFGLLPTATTSTATGAGFYGDGGMNLQTKISLLPTPRANDSEKRGNISDDPRNGLPARIQHLLPTPTASEHKRTFQTYANPTLAEKIIMLPTPTAAMSSQYAEDIHKSPRNSPSLPTIIEGSKGGMNTGYRLQPAFVEWMMGFPPGWTELETYPPQPRIKRRPAKVTDSKRSAMP